MKDILLAIICALVASSGFWALMWKQIDKKDNKSKLLIGLGHDRIMTLGIRYIERGYITTDEYENLNKYLYSKICKHEQKILKGFNTVSVFF